MARGICEIPQLNTCKHWSKKYARLNTDYNYILKNKS